MSRPKAGVWTPTPPAARAYPGQADRPDDFTKDPEPRWMVKALPARLVSWDGSFTFEPGWEPFAVDDGNVFLRRRTQ
jgi:hypothetical protein